MKLIIVIELLFKIKKKHFNDIMVFKECFSQSVKK